MDKFPCLSATMITPFYQYSFWNSFAKDKCNSHPNKSQEKISTHFKRVLIMFEKRRKYAVFLIIKFLLTAGSGHIQAHGPAVNLKKIRRLHFAVMDKAYPLPQLGVEIPREG